MSLKPERFQKLNAAAAAAGEPDGAGAPDGGPAGDEPQEKTEG